MAKQEISILEFELESSGGKLDALRANWDAVPAIPENIMCKSKGYSAASVDEIVDATKQVRKSFDTLLANSIEFFESVGVHFSRSDETGAKIFEDIVK